MNISKKIGRRYSLLDAMLMGKRLGINWQKEKFTVGDLLVGMHYELEHGKVDPSTNVTNDSPKKTAKIAWAHLKERPDYYVQLMKIDPPKKLEKRLEKKAYILSNRFYKEARDMNSEDEKERTNDDLKRGAAGLLGGAGLIATNRHRLLGEQRVYHGTTAEAAKGIKQSGIKASFGGKKGGVADAFAKFYGIPNESFGPIKNSTGHTYVSKNSAVARVNANIAAAKDKILEEVQRNSGKNPNIFSMKNDIDEAIGKVNRQGRVKGGKVIKANIPLHRFKKDFEADPEYAFSAFNAMKSGKDIPIEEIVGSKAKLKDKIKYKVKNMPRSIKTDPKRFALGVGGTALGAAAVTTGALALRSAFKRKKKEREENAQQNNAEKTATEALDFLYKQASFGDRVRGFCKQAAYLKDINCEECHYVGPPDPDGTCPKCGSIGGHKALGLQKKYEKSLKEIEDDAGSADDAAREEQENLQSMIYGG